MRHEAYRIAERAATYRASDPGFAAWAAGYGVVEHEDRTQVRVYEMADLLAQRGAAAKADVYRILVAADKLANAAMWLVVHMTYARRVRLEGRDLAADDFKPNPEGHTGGSLNMVPAYVGYLAANAVTGLTRAWLMGQGHCVAAVDATNVLAGNTTPAHAERYGLTDEGLTRLVNDFYSYAIDARGRPESPLGSHVNVHTAGGLSEGGYLGFAELLYVHMPLPGERLVVFLSDGAFEEQRGSDWAPRWWRAEDSGLVTPFMIANGRRIDQRTTMAQTGGVAWFRDHLRLNGFDPIDLDGRDPAAFAWGVFEMEERLTGAGRALAAGRAAYPVPLPYGIAETVKGHGFPGAGTNRAHNLPLSGNPSRDARARHEFNTGARRLWVPPGELEEALGRLDTHERQRRARERDHALMRRQVRSPALPEPPWRETDVLASPMEGIDAYLVEMLRANPGLRPRIGNPDEMRSNRMNATLDLLRHRVSAPEPGVAEAVDGAVITALNEEAVVCAALANKGGINAVVSYEAFAVKMLGAIRQELIFARHQREAGMAPGWLGVPVLLSSHVWENGKNEQSHQDPTLCEALLGEMCDGSRVVFPADWNSACAALRAVYGSRGQVWSLVAAKGTLPVRLEPEQARAAVSQGAVRLRGSGGADERLLLAAVGAYQLEEVCKASDRLGERGVAHAVVYLLEPSRFRAPRDGAEAAFLAALPERWALFPEAAEIRIFATHTRIDPLLGIVRPLDTGRGRTQVLGYINRGGTLDVNGMLYANRCTWAHIVAAAAEGLSLDPEALLAPEEVAAVRGERAPAGVLFG